MIIMIAWMYCGVQSNDRKGCDRAAMTESVERTVDADGNALVESEAILTEECRGFDEGVHLGMARRRVVAAGLNELEIEAVGLCNCQYGNDTAAALE